MQSRSVLQESNQRFLLHLPVGGPWRWNVSSGDCKWGTSIIWHGWPAMDSKGHLHAISHCTWQPFLQPISLFPVRPAALLCSVRNWKSLYVNLGYNVLFIVALEYISCANPEPTGSTSYYRFKSILSKKVVMQWVPTKELAMIFQRFQQKIKWNRYRATGWPVYVDCVWQCFCAQSHWTHFVPETALSRVVFLSSIIWVDTWYNLSATYCTSSLVWDLSPTKIKAEKILWKIH